MSTTSSRIHSKFLGHTWATAPFDREDGDIILLSSDLVRFSLHKAILSISSPVFTDMFTLGSLDGLARVLYPVCRSSTMNLPDAAKVMEAAKKYQIMVVMDAMTDCINKFIDGTPLAVFVIACRLNLEATARAAAERAVRMPADSAPDHYYIPEMENITAGSYFRLLSHIRRGDTVAPPSYWAAFSFVERHPSANVPRPNALTSVAVRFSAVLERNNPSSWHPAPEIFVRHPADCIVRCSDGVEVPTHGIVLSLASPVLAELITASHETPTVLELPEESALVFGILRMLYGYPLLDSSESVITLAQQRLYFPKTIRALTKYKVSAGIQQSRISLRSLLRSHPLSVYFIAHGLGWREEAEEAATMVVSDPNINIQTKYVAEMEGVSAKAYFDLLRYHHSYETSLNAVVEIFNTRQLAGHFYPDPGYDWAHALFAIPNVVLNNEKIYVSILKREVEKNDRTFGTSFIRNLVKESRMMEDKMRTSLAQCKLNIGGNDAEKDPPKGPSA